MPDAAASLVGRARFAHWLVLLLSTCSVACQSRTIEFVAGSGDASIDAAISHAQGDAASAPDAGPTEDSDVAVSPDSSVDISVTQPDASMQTATPVDAGGMSDVEDAGAPLDTEATPLQGWFVDSISGDDANDGRSERTAFSSLGKLKQSPVQSGETVYLSRGSLWREELIGLPAGIVVRAYGTGPRPLIDGSDVADHASFQKTTDLANVYEIMWSHSFAEDGGKAAHRVWEDGIRLRRMPDLASCDATPGSFYADTPTAVGPDKIYVHASDSSDVSKNAHVYELTRRRWALQLYEHRNHASVYSVHTRRNAHADGSLAVDGFVSDCLAEDGRIHNVFIRGIAEDTIAWKIEPPAIFGQATMFVTYEDRMDLPGVVYRRCKAIAEGDAAPNGEPSSTSTVVGFYGHTSGGKTFQTAVYEECEASGVALGFGFQQVETAVYYKSKFEGGQIGVGALPNATLAVLGGLYHSRTQNGSLVRMDNDYGVPKKIIVRGVRSMTDGLGRQTQPFWINRADGEIEITRSTFAQTNGTAFFWMAAGSFRVENNIFYGNGPSFRVDASAHSTSENNLYFDMRMLPMSFVLHSEGITGLPEWQNATGQDLNSRDADPLFVGSPFEDQFEVDPTSPARALAAGADYESEEEDSILQSYRAALIGGLIPPTQ